MNKKTIIQIIVIVAAFAGSGIVLYKGMSQKKSAPAPVPAAMTAGQEGGIANILPLGKTLDFKVLDKQNLEYGTLIYPKLDPNQEVGIEGQALIKSPAVTQQ